MTAAFILCFTFKENKCYHKERDASVTTGVGQRCVGKLITHRLQTLKTSLY